MSIYILNSGASHNTKAKAAYVDDPSNSLVIYKRCFNVIIEKMEEVVLLIPHIASIYSLAEQSNENEASFEKNTNGALSIIEQIIEICHQGIYSCAINDELVDTMIALENTLDTIKWRICLLQKCRKELYAKQVIGLCLGFVKIIANLENQ